MEKHIPPSYRFAPTVEEMVTHYLYNKVHHMPLSTSAVQDCDLYGDENEWIKFFEETGETSLHFFTKLRKKTEKGSRVERETISGKWRTQKNTKIFGYCGGDKKQHIASRRNFTFVPKRGSQVKGKWVMHEFRLDGVLFNGVNDYVLCRIKKKPPPREEQNGSADADVGVVRSMNIMTMIPLSSADHHINNMNEDEASNTTDWSNEEDLENILINSSKNNEADFDSKINNMNEDEASNTTDWSNEEDIENILVTSSANDHADFDSKMNDMNEDEPSNTTDWTNEEELENILLNSSAKDESDFDSNLGISLEDLDD